MKINYETFGYTTEKTCGIIKKNIEKFGLKVTYKKNPDKDGFIITFETNKGDKISTNEVFKLGVFVGREEMREKIEADGNTTVIDLNKSWSFDHPE